MRQCEALATFISSGAAVFDLHSMGPLDRFYALWSAFFADSAKHMLAARPGELAGYHSMRSERAVGAVEADNKEFFQFIRGAGLPESLNLATEALWLALAGKAQSVLSDLAGELDLPRLAYMLTDPSRMVMRIAHYPMAANGPGVGAARHTDIDLLTLLPPATERGLFVQTESGDWCETALASGEVLILAGDMVEFATRGRVRAAAHRVDPGVKHRLSVSFFANPPDATLLDGSSTAGRMYLDRVGAMS